MSSEFPSLSSKSPNEIKSIKDYPAVMLTISLLNVEPYLSNRYYQRIKESLMKLDPGSIDLLIDPQCQLFEEKILNREYLDQLRKELGTYVPNEDACIPILKRYLADATDPEVISALKKTIKYAKIKPDDIFHVDCLPFSAMEKVLPRIPNRDQLEQCLKILQDTVDSNLSDLLSVDSDDEQDENSDGEQDENSDGEQDENSDGEQDENSDGEQDENSDGEQDENSDDDINRNVISDEHEKVYRR
jgi:hypothetical protein